VVGGISVERRPVRPDHLTERAGRARVALVVVCGLAVALLSTGCGRWAGGVGPLNSDKIVKNTAWGPLSDPGRLLIVKVRLANLWELPMAEEAATRAQSPRVREISKMIAYQHRYILEPRVRAVAAQLKISLPTRPTSQQAAWMADIRSKSGAAYDATYVKWLRFAHGQIFALIGLVRGTGQNTVVRSFAEDANKFVMYHMQMLESTGLTRPDAFPPPPQSYS
jgi:predicted outer membrane protein